MADLTETVVYRGGMRGSGLKYVVLEATGDASDTVTVGELDTIKDTVCLRLDTGAEVDCTEATNVVTIGSGPSDTPLLIIVSGW
jgi:hypothetical protein